MTNLEDKLSASIKTDQKDTAAPASTQSKPTTRKTATAAAKPASSATKPTTAITTAKRTTAATKRPVASKPAAAKTGKPSADDIQVPAHDTTVHPRRVWPD